MDIDSIRYGNPTHDQIPYLSSSTYADSLFADLTLFTFPKNSSEATIEELNSLVDSLKTIEGNEEYIKRYSVYDRAMIKYFKDGLIKNGIDENEVNGLIDGVIQDTLPLLTKLKYHFQRPRPYQLAEYYKLKLFPYKSYSANTPSFPSGHAFQAKLLTEVIGNNYPDTYAFMRDLFNDICYSRIYLGLHYQSDIDVGIFCAEKVLQLSDFKQKYRL